MKILCIDSNSILNRAFYGIRPLTTKEGINTNAIFGFLNILLKLCDEIKPDSVACAFDLKAPTFRHKRYDGYKAQRKGMPPELAEQVPLIKEILENMGYKIVSLEGYEADDILGTFARKCDKTGDECYIATGDRDSLQLVSNNTTVLLASSKMGKTETIVCNPDYIVDKYGVTPKELIEVKALMGDASDNIPGVAGVGEKTALKLISQYKSIDYIYEHIDEIDVTKGVRAKLVADKEKAFMSRELAEIFCEVPIDIELESYKIKGIDNDSTYAVLSRLEMASFIKRLGLTEGSSPQYEIKNEVTPKFSAKVAEISDTKTICKSDIISIFVEIENSKFKKLVAVADKQVYIFKDDIDGFDEAVKEILSSETKKTTYDCKEIYFSALYMGIDVKSVVFDVSLSAYLLNANSSSYEMALLFSQYEVAKAEVEGDIPQEEQENVENICRCIALMEVLKKEIHEKGMDFLLYEVEIPLAEVLASMEIDGFSIDIESLDTFGKELDGEISELEKRIYLAAGEEFNINSPKQMGVILFEKLMLPIRKKTKTGYSTGAEVLESLRGEHPIIDDILRYRTLAKLKSTYVDGFKKVVGSDGRIHSHFKQTETRTGRISSTEPNMQNIPVRTEIGKNLRKFFKASEGCMLVDADYSQIELRVLAHISDDENMKDAFLSGEDIHRETAAQVFDLPPLFITPEMRSRAKAVNFGIVYGIGAFSLSKDIGVSVAEADKYIKNYLKKFSGVKRYMEETVAFAKENGYVKTVFGRIRQLPEISSSNHNLKKFGERVAMNMPIQGTAADIIKIAMVKVYKRLKAEELRSRLILQVHDELIVEAPLDEVEKASKILKDEMEAAVDFSVKMLADLSTGKTWFEAK